MTAQFKLSSTTLEDTSGIPIPGGKVYFYDPGTTTPRAVYSDDDLTVLLTQPALSNSSGRWPQIYVQPGTYRFRVYDASDALLFEEDNVDPGLVTSVSGTLPVASGGTGASTAAGARSNLGAAAQSDLNTANVTIGTIQTDLDTAETQITSINSSISALQTAVDSVIDPSGSKRQVIQTCPVDTNGLSSFFAATYGSLAATTQNITVDAPLVVSVAKGFGIAGAVERFGLTSANLTFSGLTPSTTNYAYVDVATDGTLTAGFSVLAPTYQRGGSPLTGADQFTFQIDRMKGYVGNGTTAVESNRVFIGELVTSGSAVVSTVGYQPQGFSDVTRSGSLPLASTATSISHNIGIQNIRLRLYLKCVTTEAGYTAGQIVHDPVTIATDYNTLGRVYARNSVTLYTGTTPFSAQGIAGAGASFRPTAANWNLGIIAERDF
jgi:hypothetical protein